MANWICGIGWAVLLLWPLWFKYRRDQGFSQLDDSDGIIVNEHPRVIEHLYANRLPSWLRGKYDSYKRAAIKRFYEDDKPTYVTDGRGNTAVRVKNRLRFKSWLREQNLL